MKKQVSILFLICGVLFTACMLIANVISSKIFSIGAWSAPAGVLIFPLAYVLNDVIVEIWDYGRARLIIWIGFGVNLLAAAFYLLSIALPPAPFYDGQEAFRLVLGGSVRIVFASLAAWLVGSLLNAYIMNVFKTRRNGPFPVRAIVSTIFGESVDSLIFITVAFAGQFPVETLAAMIVMQASVKIIYEIIIMPVTIVVVGKFKKIKLPENVK